MIRRAKESDIPALGALLSQVLEVHRAGRPDIFKKGSRKYTDEELLSILADKDKPVFVYEENGEVFGYAFCIVKDEPETNNLFYRRVLYLDDLCVDGKKRRLGIGKQLYEAVKEYAVSGSFDALTLNVWHLNGDALAFYRSLGLQPLKTTMECKLK